MVLDDGRTAIPTPTDVVIAGGGPTGLFLALDLSRRGIRSVVLEPRRELDWLRPRAKTTNARTMTHLRRIGLAGALRAAAPLSVSYSDSIVFCTSLVGHELLRFREVLQLQQSRYELQPECGQQAPQPLIEQVLRDAVSRDADAVLALGARYVRSVRSSEGTRSVEVESDDGGQLVVACRHVVGADGLGSTVRRDLGIELEGTSATKSNLGVVFRGEGLRDLVTLEPAVQYWVVGQQYGAMLGPLDAKDTWWAIIQGWDPLLPKFAGTDSTTLLRTLIGADVEIDVLAEDPWTARMLLASSYGSDAAYLAGDAAHSNPPWGGHGFNTGIGDASNLAWKLAATLRGWAGPALLDSYEIERRPVARRTIEDAVANAAVQADDVASQQLASDGPEGDAARAAAARALQVKESEFYSLGLVLGYDYASSPLTTPSGEPAPAPHPIRYEPSAAPGCLLPHVWSDVGDSLYDLLGPDFTLVVLRPNPELDVGALSARARESTVPLDVRVLASGWPDLRHEWAASLVLVRPDQHVAWRGDDVDCLFDALYVASGHVGPVVSQHWTDRWTNFPD